MENSTIEKSAELGEVIEASEKSSNPNIFNLKIEDIHGTNTEVLTIYLYELEKFMNTHDLSKSEQILYSSLHKALQYYKDVSDPTTPFFQNMLQYTEQETAALTRQYPHLDIKTSLRIKSPISAYNKILSKIKEYVQKGRDLNDITSSLRDFIGIRRIIDFKDYIFERPEESTNQCYDFSVKQLNYQSKSDFDFIPVGDKKLAALKAPHPYVYNPKEEKVYIPKTRPKELDEKYDSYLKDYISYPTEYLYQTLQYCTFLPFAKKYAVEYQLRTRQMHNYAENGGANHSKYKNNFSEPTAESESSALEFRRANLPIEYVYDSKIKRMRRFTLDESMKSHFGYSFYEKFGLTEEELYANFSKEEQDTILALKSKVYYDPVAKTYTNITPKDIVRVPSIVKISPEELHKTIEEKDPVHSGFDIGEL